MSRPLFFLLLSLFLLAHGEWPWSNEDSTESVYDMLNWDTELLDDYPDDYLQADDPLPQEDLTENLDDIKNLPHNKHLDAINNHSHLWKAGAIVPFLIQDQQKLARSQQVALVRALQFFHNFTNVRFIKKAVFDKDYILITHNMSHCFSEELGRKGGAQILNLDNTLLSCWQYGTIIHELMHCLGFLHKHSHQDRDEYVNVHWKNISQNLRSQFFKAPELNLTAEPMGQYDYGSIMGYPSKLPGGTTILTAKEKPIQENNDKMGNRKEPTKMDIQKINELYAYGKCNLPAPICPSVNPTCTCALPVAKPPAPGESNVLIIIGESDPEAYFPDAPFDNHVIDSNYAEVVTECTGIHSVAKDNIVYFVCTDQGTSYSFDPAAGLFSTGPAFTPKPGAAVTSHSYKFVICGGQNKDTILRSCQTFDPLTGKVTTLPSMNRPRSRAMMVTHSDWLFVFGGKFSLGSLKDPHSISFEYMNMMANQKRWIINSTRSTPVPEEIRPAAFLNFIVFCRAKSCQKFDIETFEWTDMAAIDWWNLDSPKCTPMKASADGKNLYALGDCYIHWQSTYIHVGVLDSSMRSWEKLPDILRQRKVHYTFEPVLWSWGK